MLVTGRFGLKTYDLSNPAKPKFLDEITAEQLRLPGDPPYSPSNPQSTFWQNEDMDVDNKRKLALLSRDPRAYRGSTSREPGEADPNGATNIAGVYVVDAKNPADLKLLSFEQLPTGHTTSCINDCEWLWTGGPAPTSTQETGGLARRAPDHRHRPARSEEPGRLSAEARRPVPPGRRHRLRARRRRRRRGHRLGRRSRRHARLPHQGPALGPGAAQGALGHAAGPGPVRGRRSVPADHQREVLPRGLAAVAATRRERRWLDAQLVAPDRLGRAARLALQEGPVAARYRGVVRPGLERLPRGGQVHDLLAEGLLQRRGLALDAGEAVPHGGRGLVGTGRQ